MRTPPAVRKRSIVIRGHATSVSLEEEFWITLKKIAKDRKTSLQKIIAKVDKKRTVNLSSALRVFILKEILRDQLLNG